MLNEKAKSQQTALWELVETEVAYIRTLKVIQDVINLLILLLISTYYYVHSTYSLHIDIFYISSSTLGYIILHLQDSIEKSMQNQSFRVVHIFCKHFSLSECLKNTADCCIFA